MSQTTETNIETVAAALAAAEQLLTERRAEHEAKIAAVAEVEAKADETNTAAAWAAHEEAKKDLERARIRLERAEAKAKALGEQHAELRSAEQYKQLEDAVERASARAFAAHAEVAIAGRVRIAKIARECDRAVYLAAVAMHSAVDDAHAIGRDLGLTEQEVNTRIGRGRTPELGAGKPSLQALNGLISTLAAERSKAEDAAHQAAAAE